MRIVGILVLMFGVGLAGAALYYSKQYFAAYEQSQKASGPEMVRVVVARTKLDYGDNITKKNIRVVEWPKASQPEGSFTAVTDVIDAEGEIMRRVLRTIEPGEPILRSKVTGFGEDLRMAFRLSEGKRAVSLPIDAVSGVAGFIAPGDRVDILLTESRSGSLSSRVILTDIPVIATDQQRSSDALSARVASTATLEVDARQAQILALAQQVGRLSLTLRGMNEAPAAPDAEVPAGTGGTVSLDELLGIEKEAAPVKNEEPTIRVRRGIKLQSQAVGGPEASENESPQDAAPEQPEGASAQ